MNQLFNPTTVRAEYNRILVDGVYCHGNHPDQGDAGKHETLLASAAHAQIL